MSGNLIQVYPQVLVTGTAVAATQTSTATNIHSGDSYTLLINVTAASGTSPTLDIVAQCSFDGGTTFANLPIRSAQITAATVQYISFRQGLGQGEAGFNQAGVADTGGALTKDVVFDWRYFRLKQTVGGTNPSFTYTCTLFVAPRNQYSV